ncbi:MAG: caspase family protein, partial [Bacteroidia bacterium]|nr:caspase family protein [Bacteroidia bacterium]
TENLNEYRIERTITLNEGDNEIKIEAKNTQGVTTSESRVINYFVQKIDQTYVERRLALVIGNADYLNSNPLQNPVNDAKAIAAALRDVGFTVLPYYNSDLKTMKKAMDEFGEKLKDYTVGLFYYAGHGMQVNGKNYLIPVDASLKVEQDVDYDCVDAGRLLGKMEAAGTGTNIVILDACRDNPFARSWSGRSAGQEGTGLAFMNAPSGSIVAYATSPGKTASDGTGKNGLYTEAFLQYIKVPSLSIEDFFKNVRATVEKKSNKTQTPWESTSLKGNFYFTIK